MLRSKQLHHGLTASLPAGKFNFMPRNPQFRPFHATSIAPASVTMRTFVSNVNPIHVTPVSCIPSIHRIGYGLTMSLTAFYLQSHANRRHAQSMPLRWSHSLHSPATRSTSSRLPHARVRALPGVSSASPSSGSSSSSSNSSRTSNPSLIKRLRNSIRTFFSRSRLKIPFASTTPLTTASASISDSNNSSSSSSTLSASSSSSPSSSSTDYPASPLLFDASHLLSGLHEDKKERLRCIEVDNSGNFRDVEFSRAELSSMLELHPRDLRFLDTSMRNLPSILARRKVIIVNLEMFKALITADRVLMFDPWYPHVQSVVAPLQTSILNGGELFEGKPIPFEFIALEHILQTVCSTLEDRFDLYISSLEPLLSSTESNDNSSSWSSKDSPSFNALVQEGSGSTLMHLLQLKNGLTSFEVTLRETGGALQDLLETDEDMAQMYLTEKASGHIPVTSEHNEVEVILETYFRKVDELENEVEQNVKSITLTEEHIQIRLDSNRNSMMKLELLVSISTLGVTTAALGAALFGMNLPSHLENNPYAFWISAGLFGFIAVGIIRQGLRICSRRGIDLFQIDPKEPTLRFPHMLQSTYAHSQTLEGLNGIALAKMRRAAKLQGIPLQPTQHNYARMFNHVNNGAKHPRCDHTR